MICCGIPHLGIPPTARQPPQGHAPEDPCNLGLRDHRQLTGAQHRRLACKRHPTVGINADMRQLRTAEAHGAIPKVNLISTRTRGTARPVPNRQSAVIQPSHQTAGGEVEIHRAVSQIDDRIRTQPERRETRRNGSDECQTTGGCIVQRQRSTRVGRVRCRNHQHAASMDVTENFGWVHITIDLPIKPPVNSIYS